MKLSKHNKQWLSVFSTDLEPSRVDPSNWKSMSEQSTASCNLSSIEYAEPLFIALLYNLNMTMNSKPSLLSIII